MSQSTNPQVRALHIVKVAHYRSIKNSKKKEGLDLTLILAIIQFNISRNFRNFCFHFFCAAEIKNCFFCEKDVTRDKNVRRITENSYSRLGIIAVDLEKAKGCRISLQCWLSKTVRNRTKKKCSLASCTTSQKGLQSQRLCSLPLKNVDNELRQEVMNRFDVSGEEKACRKCRTVITAFINSNEAERRKMPSPSVCTTSVHTTTASCGRPRVNYTEASIQPQKDA